MKKLFLLVCVAVLLFSCKKEEPNPSDPTPKANYLPLKIGNYWVYQCYHVDTLGNENLLSRIDSIIVKCDTTIRNNQYYVLENFTMSGRPYLTFLRDSSGYIVTETGDIIFSATNFTDVLYFKEIYNGETLLYTLSYKMEKVDKPITVPAGKFDVLNYKGTAVIRQSDGTNITKKLNNLYANNVGKVFYVCHSVTSDYRLEGRLVRYHVQ